MAGGRGSRMGEITATKQKALLEVGGKPVIMYPLEAMANAGINKVFIITGYRCEDIASFLESLTNLPDTEVVNTDARGTASALCHLRDRIREPFVYSHSNIVFDKKSIAQIAELHSRLKPLATVTVTRKDLAKTHAHAVVTGEFVTSIEIPQLMTRTLNDLCCLGISLLEPRVFEFLGNIGPTGMMEEALATAVTMGMRVAAYQYDQDWFHLESKDDLALAREIDFRRLFG
jgi:NDP-sugar pyrophosphorylase family protein